MSISITLYEDSGPVVDNKGTTRVAVNNIGWKADGTDETGNPYAFSPVVRPKTPDELWSRSYKKYHFAKIEGTYANASRVRVKISNGITGAPPAGYETETSLIMDTALQKVRIFYKLSNIYEQPNDAWDGELRFLQNGAVVLYPAVSTIGPEDATTYPQYLTPNTTYYTQYLITQLVVPHGYTVGNIGEINITWYVDEYEDGNV